MKVISNIQSYFLSLAFLAILLSSKTMAQLSHSTTFDLNSLMTEELIAEDGQTYQRVQMENLPINSAIGAPALPVKIIKLLIPTDYDIESVSIDTEDITVITGNYPVIPMQPEVPLEVSYETPEFVVPDSVIYNGTTSFPETRVKVIHNGYFDGSNHIITLGIFPIQFDPSNNDLIVAQMISFTLHFQPAVKQTINAQFRKSSLQDIYDTILNNLVDNPQDIPRYGVKPSNLTLPKIFDMLPTYDYVIITSNALQSAFDKLVSWKTRKGYDIGIVTTDDIYLNYPDGDLISGINDNAGSIRQYLADAYYQGTVWVLLGGDHSVVPVRKGDEDNDSPYGQWTQIVTDLYFADFNGDWEVDGDINLGEKDHDDPDYHPEIFVGRLPCTSTQDIENWTKKVLEYELNPGNGDPSYLTNAYWFQGADLYSDPDNVKYHYPSTFTHTVWYNSVYHDGSEVILHMSNTAYGLIHWYAHGAPNSIRTKPESYPRKRFFTQDDYCTWGYCSEESGDGLDNFTNYPFYAINYSISCDIANPADLDISRCPGRSVSEGWTCMYPNNGGPVLLGNTLAGWSSSSPMLHQEFADLIDNGGADPGS